MLYIIGCDDVAADIEEEDKFKYIDDLAVLDAIDVKGKLKDYDVWQHVPSDIATEEKFLAASAGKSQDINNSIAAWTLSNKMKINEEMQQPTRKQILKTALQEKCRYYRCRIRLFFYPLD